MPYNPTIHHRRSVRLKGYDYSQEGAYFVTLCTRERECLFGEIANEQMQLNGFGKIVFDEWQRTPEKRANIELGEFVVMPNHFHAIIIIAHSNTNSRRGVLNTPTSHLPNGQIPDNENLSEQDVLNTLNINDVLQKQGVCNTPLRSPVQTIGAIVRGFKSAVSKQIGFSVWQRNYHEHIIRNEKSFRMISEYIMTNPAKWSDDKFYVA